MRAAAILLPLLTLACSATHSEQMLDVYSAYDSHNYAGAERAVNERLADESGEDIETLAASRGVPPEINPGENDLYLLLLEKAMIRLAQGDTKSAISILRVCRDQLDRHFQDELGGYMAAALTDDRALDYSGADYEHILVRVMLCLADLIEGEGDAYAYALQIGEMQEKILNSPLAAGEYKPRQRYQRVAIGAWLQGLILESKLDYSGAEKAYERALSYNPILEPVKLALERVKSGQGPPPNHGVVNIIYIGGRGPTYVEGATEPTSSALKIAGIAATLVTGTLSPAIQPQEISVPFLDIADPRVPPLSVRAPEVGDDAVVESALLLDVNDVAQQQHAAMMPMIEGRAVLRRVIKASAGSVGESVGYGMTRSKDKGAQAAGVAVIIGSIVGSALWAAAERADTRSWGTLPAQFHAARMELPAGQQTLRFGDGSTASVNVAAGYHSFVLVIRPNLGKQARVLVDAHSR